MKLLGWMHRKFRQNTNETPKDFSIGFTDQSSLEDLQYYHQKSNSYCNKPFTKYRQSSFGSLDGTRVEEEEYMQEEDPSAAALTELFHGFLAIGTLGRESYSADPATPAFSISVDHITENDTEVTENELKLINDELEKVLGAESRDSCHYSSGRNSHVSAGRNSHCSTGKNSENSDQNGGTVCPLQSYLLGSATESAPPMKKEHRTSLGELFQKTKMAEEKPVEKRTDHHKESDKYSAVINLMKKVVKKKMMNASLKSSNGGGTMDSATVEKKLRKILHIFNRKVHPESSLSSNQSRKTMKNEIKQNVNSNVGKSENGILFRNSDDHITLYPQRSLSKESMWSFKNNTQNGEENGGNEFWVKTDADYLVLEL